MARSPTLPAATRFPTVPWPSGGADGNDRTSVAESFPRNVRFSLRSSASPVIRTSNDRPLATSFWSFRANRWSVAGLTSAAARRNVTVLPSGDDMTRSGLRRGIGRNRRLNGRDRRFRLGQLQGELPVRADRFVV